MKVVKVKAMYMCLSRQITGKWEETIDLKNPTLKGISEELNSRYGEYFGPKKKGTEDLPIETKILVRKAKNNWLARSPHHLDGWDTELEDNDEVVFIRWFTRRIFY